MYDTPEQAIEFWARCFQSGTSSLMADKLEEAEKDLKAAVAVCEKVFKKDLRYPQSLNALALTYYKQNDYDFAETTYAKALQVAEELFPVEDQQLLPYLNGLALCLLTNRKYMRAEPLYKRALAIAEKSRGQSHVEVAAILRNLGSIYEKLNQLEQARQVYSRLALLYDQTKLADSKTIRLKLQKWGFPPPEAAQAPAARPSAAQLPVDAETKMMSLQELQEFAGKGGEQNSDAPASTTRMPDKLSSSIIKKPMWETINEVLGPRKGQTAKSGSANVKPSAEPAKPPLPTAGPYAKPVPAHPPSAGAVPQSPASGSAAGKAPGGASAAPPGDTTPVAPSVSSPAAPKPAASATPGSAAPKPPPAAAAAPPRAVATPAPPVVNKPKPPSQSGGSGFGGGAQKQSGGGSGAARSTGHQGVAENEREQLIGTTIDNRYRIDAYIGAGGMSVVYKATHLMMARTVAIKMMHSHLADSSEAFQRFQQEARSASSLAHPNIVPAHDFGITSDGLLYLVMDYVEGRTLEDLIKKGGPVPVARCVDILKQVCSGLQYAHDNGLLHRDLKPSNIMLVNTPAKADVVKIVDFGLAKSLTADPGSMKLTRTGEFVGSPLYMSPEQFRVQKLDARSDIYSLGLVAYECLTGKTAITGETYGEVVVQHFAETPLSFGEAAPQVSVPQALEWAVFKAIEKEPDDRFASADEFGRALVAALG